VTVSDFQWHVTSFGLVVNLQCGLSAFPLDLQAKSEPWQPHPPPPLHSATIITIRCNLLLGSLTAGALVSLAGNGRHKTSYSRFHYPSEHWVG
jgi:hypothetical protein